MRPALRVALAKRPSAAATGAAYDIILMATDSFGVGINARGGGDTDWADVYQYRSRAPVGISADTTPLDQAIAPDGTDYLSILEYFGKTYQLRTGRKVLLVPHSWNGTNLISTGHVWQVGDSLHEAAIVRANAAIAAAQAVYPSSSLKAIIMWESGIANDAANYVTQSLTKSAAKTALSAAITHYRSSITGATNVPIILGGLTPEQIGALNLSSNVGGQQLTDALAETARDTTGVYYIPMPSGYSDDNLHLNNAGNRFVGPLFDAILADTTAPTISTASSITVADGGPIAITLAADEYVTWSLSGTDAASFEINRTFGTGGTGGINTATATNTLRLTSDANTSYATKSSYAVTVNARDGAGNSTAKAIAITVAQPYGTGDQGPTTLTHNYAVDLTSLGFLPSPYTKTGVSYGAGLVFITLYTNGAISAISGVSLDGSPATLVADHASGDVFQTWAVVKGGASASGSLTITYTGSRDTISIEIATATGTKATPFVTPVVVDFGYRNSPIQNASSATCPANGIVLGFGYADPSVTGPVSGATQADPGGHLLYAAYRKTSGFVGVNYANGYSAQSTLVYEKSV